MGMFLELSGVIGVESNEVMDALSEFARSRNGGIDLANGDYGDPNTGVVTRGGVSATVIYPPCFEEWDVASGFLSERLKTTVFALQIHNGDLWMYILYKNGKEIGWFNTIPEYWEEISPGEKEKWSGDASLIAEVIPSVSADEIVRYFADRDFEDENPPKAYPDDEFDVCNCWQMCDFMRKVGLEYPITGDGPIQGDTFQIWTEKSPLEMPVQKKESVSPASAPKKFWWKFW